MNRIYLKKITSVSKNYLKWMNDNEVMKMTFSYNNTFKIRGRRFTREILKRYIKKINSSTNNKLFGIFIKKSNVHIGNIKLGDIHPIHKHCDIGLIIGLKEYWGQGFASEAIYQATEIGFESGLNKVYAAISQLNIASIKACVNAGYKRVGTLKKHYFIDGKYVDRVYMEKLNV